MPPKKKLPAKKKLSPKKKPVKALNVNKPRTPMMDRAIMGRLDKAQRFVYELEAQLERDPDNDHLPNKIEMAYDSYEYYGSLLAGETPEVQPTGDVFIFI
jgi:hypothetical protein